MTICSAHVLKISLDNYTNNVHGNMGPNIECAPFVCLSVQKKALQTDSSGDLLTLDCSASKHRSHGCMQALVPAKPHIFFTNTEKPQRMT